MMVLLCKTVCEEELRVCAFCAAAGTHGESSATQCWQSSTFNVIEAP